MTGGRLKRALGYLDQDTFCMTYGDGVGDIDIAATIAQHTAHGRKVTVTAVRPLSRFGQLGITGTRVHDFVEKPLEEGGWINGGFFVLDRSVGDHLDDDGSIWEREPLERLAALGEVEAHFHDGFWQPMDTLRDRNMLENLWQTSQAPWKIWP